MSIVPEPDGWDEEESPPREPSTIEAEITEPEIIGTLYTANGEVLFHVYDRLVIPFGYQPGVG